MEKTSSPTTTTTTTSDKGKTLPQLQPPPPPMGMGMGSETLSRIACIIQSSEDSNNKPPQFDSKYFHSHLIRGLLKTHRVERGRLSSLLSVKPPVTVRARPNPNSPFRNSDLFDVFHAALIKGRLRISIWGEYILPPSLLPKGNSNFSKNIYGTLHGGAVASVAEIMSIACARTVVGEDKELFLGELSTTYLSAATRNAELTVDASVIRSGRSLTVIAVEFKVKDTGKLVYTSHATFYNTPVASL
ncbi:hypothetical protein RHMOL_Rhmol08G0249200 [Rhododendron molle]|uniref:Uncharacterized protein n=1 Tax=Rhododendron molle TaxID=49168 RepID=A0ACC0MSF4_RHOML|nr:hypothetical protein RHMOL_Rhmol08G0249200 [Rhododendron molle]